MPRFMVIVAVVVTATLWACPFPGSTCESDADIAVSAVVTGQGGVTLDDATVTATSAAGARACPYVEGAYECGEFPAQIVAVRIEGPGYARDLEADVVVEDDRGVCIFESGVTLLVDIPEAAGPPCCCASIVDGDVIDEAPADSAAACAARAQGACVDQATVDQRFTPHACCADATGERCGD